MRRVAGRCDASDEEKLQKRKASETVGIDTTKAQTSEVHSHWHLLYGFIWGCLVSHPAVHPNSPALQAELLEYREKKRVRAA